MDLSETQELLKLEHKNVIRVKGIVKDFDQEQLPDCDVAGPGVIMELCVDSLYNLIRTYDISTEQTIDWGGEIASGMEYLHQNQIIHRDLKSQNIMMGHDGQLKISDLDTMIRGPVDIERDIDGNPSGTANWMAPELIRGKGVSGKVDVWSFGVVMWELVTSQIPYEGRDEAAIMWNVATYNFSLKIPDSCPPPLRKLINSCWNRTARNRPSFLELVQELDQLKQPMVNELHQNDIENT